MDFWYSFAKSVVRVYLTLCIDSVHVVGEPDIPPGPKIIVANHTNVTDGFVLPFLVKEKVHYLIQSETFTLPVLGRLLALADQIPVYVGQGREALDAAKQKLALGHSVAIFPEGRLNDGRSFHRAGAGAALLAVESGAPIIPVGFYVPDKYARAIPGHFHNRRTIARWQFGGLCFVRFGESFQIPVSIQEKVNYRELRKLTEKMMTRVAELVQQAQDEARRLNVLS
jgi:1-acyl-sn-glycerol-3-phosphate acyltransferase